VLFAPVAAAEVAGPRIPFVVGLNVVRASETEQGDYESLRTVDSIDAQGYRVTTAGEIPADDGSGLFETQIERRVSADDQRTARRMRAYFHSDDPESFPGTVPGFSAVLVNELRSGGKTAFTYVDVVSSMFGMTTARDLAGTLVKVSMPMSMSMLVNGHAVSLPVIHAKGDLTDGEDHEDFDFLVLNDPDNPIVLRWTGADNTSTVTRIDFPEPSRMEQTLAARETVEIYGIYFAFARADIRPQSDPVLKDIVSVMNVHPDWKLRIDGYTDSVGDDAANLDLSKRRAAAVKTVLVNRFHINGARLATDGFGEAAPKDSNKTPEGRARNRRVELRRQ
jgi:outer membrane protein OmpA-like peptidoglycan-associated protein